MAAENAVTLALVAYQQKDTIAAAMQACLNQQGPPIDILFSDDASTDGTAELMASTVAQYRGPHRVRWQRNPVNLGIGRHLSQVARMAQGELIVLAAGDDLAEPNRVQACTHAWEQSGRRLDLIACPLIDMLPDGQCVGTVAVDRLQDWHTLDQWQTQRPRVIGAGHAWTKRLFERCGDLDPDIAYEDQILCFRALNLGGATTLDQPLVRYRRGGTSMKAQALTGAEIRQRIARESTRHLAEARQLLKDATTLGILEPLAPQLQQELARQRYLQDLVAAPNATARAAALLSHPQPRLNWRVQKYLDVQLAGVKAWVKNRRG